MTGTAAAGANGNAASGATATASGGNPNAFQIEVTIPSNFNRSADFVAYAVANNGGQTTEIVPVFVGAMPTRAPGAATPTPIATNATTMTSSCNP